jgi:hypothetical protein
LVREWYAGCLPSTPSLRTMGAGSCSLLATFSKVRKNAKLVTRMGLSAALPVHRWETVAKDVEKRYKGVQGVPL